MGSTEVIEIYLEFRHIVNQLDSCLSKAHGYAEISKDISVETIEGLSVAEDFLLKRIARELIAREYTK